MKSISLLIVATFFVCMAHAQESICLGAGCPADNGTGIDLNDPFQSMTQNFYAQEWGDGNFSSLDKKRKTCYTLCNAAYIERKSDCREASVESVVLMLGDCDDGDEACGAVQRSMVSELDAICLMNARSKNLSCLGVTGLAKCDDEF